MRIFLFLFFIASYTLVPMSANSARNPILSGVNKIELTCIAADRTKPVEKKNICESLKANLMAEFGFPVNIIEDRSNTDNQNTTFIRVGILSIRLELWENEDRKIFGKLEWKNSMPMKGVAASNIGKSIRLSGNSSKDISAFTGALITTMRLI